MSFFATRGCGDRAQQGGPCRRWTPPKKGKHGWRSHGTNTFWCADGRGVADLKASHKVPREEEEGEEEAGEEREGDDDEYADAEDGHGDGNEDRGAKGDAPLVGEGAPGANRDEGIGVEVGGLRVKGLVHDGSVVDQGKGEVSSGAPRAPPTTQEE